MREKEKEMNANASSNLGRETIMTNPKCLSTSKQKRSAI